MTMTRLQRAIPRHRLTRLIGTVVVVVLLAKVGFSSVFPFLRTSAARAQNFPGFMNGSSVANTLSHAYVTSLAPTAKVPTRTPTAKVPTRTPTATTKGSTPTATTKRSIPTPIPTATKTTLEVLHSFGLAANDRSTVYSSLISDSAGNLYGTALGGRRFWVGYGS